MLKKAFYILLILSLSGLPNIAAVSYTPHKSCSCSQNSSSKQKAHSCCAMKHKHAQSNSTSNKRKCDLLNMMAFSMVKCSCMDDYSSTDETVLLSTKDNHSSNLSVIEQVTSETLNNDLAHFTTQFDKSSYQGTVPIYISVSSYLI